MTNRGTCVTRSRTPPVGIVKAAGAPRARRGSASSCSSPNLALFSQVWLTNSNCRAMFAFRQMKWRPRSAASSSRSACSSGSGGPYSRPRRTSRWRRLISNERPLPGSGSRESRGFERRMCEPTGQRAPRGSARRGRRSRSPPRGSGRPGPARARAARRSASARPSSTRAEGAPRGRCSRPRAASPRRRSARSRRHPGAAAGRRGSCRCAEVGAAGASGARQVPRTSGASTVLAVLVLVAEQELAGANGLLRRAALAQPVDERLRDPVAEAERLEAVE